MMVECPSAVGSSPLNIKRPTGEHHMLYRARQHYLYGEHQDINYGHPMVGQGRPWLTLEA